MIRMKSSPLVSGFSLTSLMSLLIHYQWTIFVVFNLVMASCGFAAATVNHCLHLCQNRSEMWSNAKIQN